MCKQWGSRVAKLVKRPSSAQIIISEFVGSSPTWGPPLTVQSLLQIFSLHTPIPFVSSLKNKFKKDMQCMYFHIYNVYILLYYFPVTHVTNYFEISGFPIQFQRSEIGHWAKIQVSLRLCSIWRLQKGIHFLAFFIFQKLPAFLCLMTRFLNPQSNQHSIF